MSTGTGGAKPCATANECPGSDSECQTRTCQAGVCGFSFTAVGVPTALQTAGDCKQNECDGAGNPTVSNHPADLPIDGNLCTNDVCTGGVASNPPVAMGTSCGVGLVCNATGACLGCNLATDCAGTDTECQSRTCQAGACGLAFKAAGTATAAQTAGDCKQNACDGAGNIASVIHDTDVPSDALQCTNDVCSAGVPSFPPSASGTACNQNGGTICNGGGSCVVVGVTCSDGIKNGAETGIDCGGGACNPCGVGLACGGNTDCASASCIGGTCYQNHLVINEIDYDQIGTDSAEFVEIYNGTGAPVSLAGYSVVLVNGSNSTPYLTLSLAAAGTLPAGGYLVIASASVVVPASALKVSFALGSDNIQNGSPDGIALVNTTTNTLVDALSYEGSMAAVTIAGFAGTVNLVEGTMLPAATADSNTSAGSLSRLPSGTDLNNAATDWAFTMTPTPGAPNL
jgi:hypothetical protein